MTPARIAREIVADLSVENCTRVLEPSCGDGAFLTAIMDKLTNVYCENVPLTAIELLGIEVDPLLAEQSRVLVDMHPSAGIVFNADVCEADFFREYLNASSLVDKGDNRRRLTKESFDLVVGNPPFGGTFDHEIEDALDARLGIRLGRKIKKETYAFFIVACLDLLRPGGRLVFVCSDTLLTIPTMTGLRNLLMESGDVDLREVRHFSHETDYPVLVLEFLKLGEPGRVTRNSVALDTTAVQSTPNLSWGITPELSGLFSGPRLGDFFVASSGMTTGKNELFVRRVGADNNIIEPYQFQFYDAPVTLGYELARARLGRMSDRRRRALSMAEAQGQTERRVHVLPRDEPLTIHLPDARYLPYNKANNQLLFSNPTHFIYWEDDGDAVLTYKQTGNWYLRGVGGQPYFGREGITWPLVATRFNARYLPAGYILDSGAPCAFPRVGTNTDEIYFVLGWLLSDLANRILKVVINHTRNIQSKDFERMPYPWWVSIDSRMEIVNAVKAMILEASKGKMWTHGDEEVRQLDNMFALPDEAILPHSLHPRVDCAEQLAFTDWKSEAHRITP